MFTDTHSKPRKDRQIRVVLQQGLRRVAVYYWPTIRYKIGLFRINIPTSKSKMMALYAMQPISSETNVRTSAVLYSPELLIDMGQKEKMTGRL